MNKKELPKLLKAIRDRLELRQADLARELHVSYPTINRWENGKTKPTTAVLNLIRHFVLSKRNECADIIADFFPEAEPGDEPISVRRPPMTLEEPDEETASDEPLHLRRPIAMLDLKSMEALLWQAACSIRGEKDAPKFKDYILPLIFVKRLSDVFEDEITRLIKTFGNEVMALENVEADHSLVRFYIPAEARWPVISGRKKHTWPGGRAPKTLGEQVTSAIRAVAKANESLQGVIDIVDYNETRNGERELSDNALARLIEILSKHRLGLNDVEPDFLGRAYEYLLRKFAEGQGQSAGEFFTPREVGRLIAKILRPKQGEEAYDPCCGSGGLLVKCELDLAEREGRVAKPLKLYGQELTGASFAIARMNMVIHDMEGEIVRGNTMTNPKFREGGRLKRFDIVVTNPMWNQDNFSPEETYEKDPLDRFSGRGGFAPRQSADWAWLQHIHASLKDTGRAAIVLDTGAASRGSGSQGDNKEKAIRKWFIQKDLVEAVILLPDNLFYNTTAAGIIVVLNNAKPKERMSKVLMINAGAEFEKGRPKNFLTEAAIDKIAAAVRTGKDAERFAKLLPAEKIGDKNDFNLSPARYIETTGATEHRDIQDILADLAKLKGTASRQDKELEEIFTGLGYEYS
ncbi:MAG: N-6 DNA methylase [Elusimicrobia bacterium]|nr:N-6 DNA methylase [Elusimicrobiota bacterium]